MKTRLISSPRLADCGGGCGGMVAVGYGGDGDPAGHDHEAAYEQRCCWQHHRCAAAGGRGGYLWWSRLRC